MNALLQELGRALDPVQLCYAIGMNPDPWQEDVLGSDHPRILLNCSRQSGKSSVAALLAVHTALYERNSTVLLLSRALRQAQELFKVCLADYRALGRPVPAEAESALSLTLENGSRIVSLPGKSGATVRGFAKVRLLVIDEASQVEDELITALRPMLAVSGGRMIALSTPYGKRGWWWDAWANGGSAWKRVQVTADECPRVGQHYPGGRDEYLLEERRALGARGFRQEFFCEFNEQNDQVFGEEIVDRAFSREIKAHSGGIHRLK